MKNVFGFLFPERVFLGYILCTCASDSIGDLVYASLVKNTINILKFNMVSELKAS